MLTCCPACDAPAADPFFSLTSLPVHGSAVLPDAASARAVPVGDQVLALCPRCGVVFNREYDESRLEHGIHDEEPQHQSPRFAAYLAEITARWVDRYGLVGQHVVEIGCGSGDFAAELLNTGAGSVTGVDPRFTADRVPREFTGRLTAVPERYAAAQVEPGTAALVCRHTMERIPTLAAFGAEVVAGMRRAGSSMFLTEVPDLGRILTEGAFWDLQYERCTYFTPATLAAFLGGLGMAEPAVRTTYSDQYVVAEAALGTGAAQPLPAAELDRLDTACRAFAARVGEQVQRWRGWLAEHAARGDEAVVWGGGAKGLTFLNLVAGGDAKPVVRAVVDVIPGLQGQYMAGLGLPIRSPDALVAEPPRSVLLMNPVYLGEVRKMLDERGLRSTALLAV